jgi:hypothetical protein
VILQADRLPVVQDMRHRARSRNQHNLDPDLKKLVLIFLSVLPHQSGVVHTPELLDAVPIFNLCTSSMT